MTTTNTRQALLQAVLDAPDDDAVRLVYADFLEEAGEPERAEFIRVQIELENMPATFLPEGVNEFEPHEEPPNQRFYELANREDELLDAPKNPNGVFSDRLPNRTRWGISFTIPSGWRGHDIFRRGFVESITCSSTDWLTHHAEILASHPVATVRLTDWPTKQFVESGRKGLLSSWLKHSWPRITFRLPGIPDLDDFIPDLDDFVPVHGDFR